MHACLAIFEKKSTTLSIFYVINEKLYPACLLFTYINKQDNSPPAYLLWPTRLLGSLEYQAQVKNSGRPKSIIANKGESNWMVVQAFRKES